MIVVAFAFALIAGAPAVNAENDSQTASARQVPKTGAAEIPEGKHLVRDRAGLIWLLPFGMYQPPEREMEIRYFKTREEPVAKGKAGRHLAVVST